MSRPPAVVRPRWRTPLPPGVVGSWGPEVAHWARRELGIELDPWQQIELNRMLAVDDRERLVHRTYLLSVARQNGKTLLMRALIGWALTAGETPAWERVLGVAHDRAQARLIYEPVMIDLQPIRRRFPRGGLHITRYLGIRSDLYGRHREYHVASKESRNTVRGTVNDLVPFDEMRTQINYETWNALEPTTTTRQDALVVGTSTAGDDRSVLLRDWWERMLRIIDGAEPFAGFGGSWYAADDTDPPDDPRTWRKANPALGRLGELGEKAIRDSLYSLSTNGFRQERLNLWAEGTDEWLPPGVWPAATRSQPGDREPTRIVFAAEATPTWRRATVTVALVTGDDVWVGIAGELDAGRTSSSSVPPRDLIRLVARLAREWGVRELAYAARSAAAPHLEAWAKIAKVRAIPMQTPQLQAASELFRSELIGGRLTHDDEPLLAQQARVARPSGPLEAGTWYLSIRDSLGEVDAIRACAWAAWAAIAPEARPPTPQIFTPRPREP